MLSREDDDFGHFVPTEPKKRELSDIQVSTKGVLKDSPEGGEVIAFDPGTKDLIAKLHDVLVGQMGLEEGFRNPTKEKNGEWFRGNFVNGGSILVENWGNEIIISFWREKSDRVWVMNTFVDPEADWYTPISEGDYQRLSEMTRTCLHPRDKYCKCATCVEMKLMELDLRGKGTFRLAELKAHLTDTPYYPEDDKTDPREMKGWTYEDWK